MGVMTTLVLGGTGKTGRRIARRLAYGGFAVRIGSRTGTPPFDWNDQNSWAPALRDVTSAYVAFAPDLAVPGAVDTVGSFAETAVAQGVRRLVLLSGRGEAEAQQCEIAVQKSGAEWTVLRASWFAQNFSEDYLLEPILAGEVVLPAGDVAEPFVDAEDIADVAVAALTEDRHAGEVYELTGPRALTFAAAVHEIAQATGREIRYAQVSPQEYAAGLTEHGVPSEHVWLLNYLFTTVLDGRNAHTADGVERALERTPRDFGNFVRETAGSGIWTP